MVLPLPNLVNIRAADVGSDWVEEVKLAGQGCVFQCNSARYHDNETMESNLSARWSPLRSALRGLSTQSAGECGGRKIASIRQLHPSHTSAKVRRLQAAAEFQHRSGKQISVLKIKGIVQWFATRFSYMQLSLNLRFLYRKNSSRMLLIHSCGLWFNLCLKCDSCSSLPGSQGLCNRKTPSHRHFKCEITFSETKSWM